MSRHRSLAEAISQDPEKVKFIQGTHSETCKPANTTTQIAVAPDSNESEIAVHANSEKGMPTTRGKTAKAVKTSQMNEDDSREGGTIAHPRPRLTHAVVPVTTRFKQETAEALRRASLERKLAGETPSTQQQIVELAVAGWLENNGYF